MFRLSQKADYGLILLSSFASVSKKTTKGEPLKFISVSSVANKYKISAKFLSQVASDLKKAGFISSREGVAGGYALARRSDEIKLIDVLRTLDGEFFEGKCFEEDHECVCGARDMWIQMKKDVEKNLGKKTVADLINQNQKYK